MTIAMGRNDSVSPLGPLFNDVWALRLAQLAGQQYIYAVQAQDPNAAAVLTYSLLVAPAGMTINPTTGVIQWTPSANQVRSKSGHRAGAGSGRPVGDAELLHCREPSKPGA